jgi:hypothetical protein
VQGPDFWPTPYTYIHTFIHTSPWIFVLLEEPQVVQLLKNFPAFYRTRKFYFFSSLRSCVTFRNKMFFFIQWGVVISTPNRHSGGSSIVVYPRLLTQYIRSYPPYLEVVSSIRNPRTRQAVVTKDPLNMVCVNTTSTDDFRTCCSRLVSSCVSHVVTD